MWQLYRISGSTDWAVFEVTSDMKQHFMRSTGYLSWVQADGDIDITLCGDIMAS